MCVVCGDGSNVFTRVLAHDPDALPRYLLLRRTKRYQKVGIARILHKSSRVPVLSCRNKEGKAARIIRLLPSLCPACLPSTLAILACNRTSSWTKVNPCVLRLTQNRIRLLIVKNFSETLVPPSVSSDGFYTELCFSNRQIILSKKFLILLQCQRKI